MTQPLRAALSGRVRREGDERPLLDVILLGVGAIALGGITFQVALALGEGPDE